MGGYAIRRPDCCPVTARHPQSNPSKNISSHFKAYQAPKVGICVKSAHDVGTFTVTFQACPQTIRSCLHPKRTAWLSRRKVYMPSTPHHHRHAQAGLMATLAVAGSTAWAQTCDYTITTTAAAVPATVNPVPSLSMLGVALLAAAMAFVAWRRAKFPGARFMAIALVAAAAMLANQGGGGLVQQAYAAMVSLTNPAGETLTTNPSPSNGETVTFTNNSGAPLVISSMLPALGNCTDGSTLAIGAACSGTASCQGLQCQNPNEDENNNCLCRSGYARNTATNACVLSVTCGSVITGGPELICGP